MNSADVIGIRRDELQILVTTLIGLNKIVVETRPEADVLGDVLEDPVVAKNLARYGLKLLGEILDSEEDELENLNDAHENVLKNIVKLTFA